MRIAYPLAILCIALSVAPSMAQEAAPVERPGEWTGPVVGGRHRQPTDAEIQARQRAEGASPQALQQRSREQDKVIDDLYKELMTPVPSGKPGERSGDLGQPAR